MPEIAIRSTASPDLVSRLRRKLDEKAKPPGSLGRLESLALQIGLVQQTSIPRLKQPHLLVFAADHGLVDEGVSAWSGPTSEQMVKAILSGQTAISVFSRQSGLELRVVNAGLRGELAPHSNLYNFPVAQGTRNSLQGPAMTELQCQEAMTRGAELVCEVNSSGGNVILLGDLGTGSTSAASLLMSHFCRQPLERCVGTGSGLSADGLERKLEVLQAVRRRCPNPVGTLDALAEYGGFEIAMMAGTILACASARMPVVIDGFNSTSAVLVAHAMNPNILDYCIFSHCSGEPEHRLMLEFLKVRPLLELEVRLGEGTGAALAYPLLQSAVNFLNEMVTMDGAGYKRSVAS
jgi:nicotinate-nucleotide--dimethylbenzimidazole phosphoribosyltransferase